MQKCLLSIWEKEMSYVYESINTCRSELLKRLSHLPCTVSMTIQTFQSYTPQIGILSHGVYVSATAANPKRITKPFFASPHLFLRVALFNKRNVLLHNSIEREKTTTAQQQKRFDRFFLQQFKLNLYHNKSVLY